MTSSIDLLHQQYQQLQQQFSQSNIDQKNWFNHSDVIVSSAFSTRSDELKDYFEELQANIYKLNSLTDTDYLHFVADKITQQFACLRSLLNSATINNKDRQHRKLHQARVQQAKQFARQASQSSQSLYAELSQLQEYERRLFDMVQDKQKQLNQYSGTKFRQQYQQEVLAYQQRLGRCRQALSKVEEQIQRLDDNN